MKRLVWIILALVLVCTGCSSIAEQDWTLQPPTDWDNAFAAAAPQTVSYPLAGENALSLLTTDQSAADCLAASAEATGVTLQVQVLSMDTLSDRVLIMAEAGDLPDLIWQYTRCIDALAMIDVEMPIIDLTPYLATDAPNYLSALSDPAWLQNYMFAENTLLDDGEAYAFYQLCSGSEALTYGPWIRGDWLEALDLESPQTYDEYFHVLCAFRDAYGPTDAILLPYYGVPQGDYLAAGYGISAYCAGQDYSTLGFYVEDGVVKFGPMEPAYWDFAARLHSWYEAGLISTDFVSYDHIDTQIYTGNVGLAYLNESEARSLSQAMEADTGGFLTPICDAVLAVGDETHLSPAGNQLVCQEAYSIAATCPDPELAVRWCDYWYSADGQTRMNWGEAGLTYTLDAAGNPVYTQAFLEDAALQSRYLCQSLPGIWNCELALERTDPDRLAAHQIWSTGKDNALRYPADMTFSAADEEHFAGLFPAIQTYAQSLTDQLILGAIPLTDQEKCVAYLRELGIDKCLACLQAYLDGWTT